MWAVGESPCPTPAQLGLVSSSFAPVSRGDQKNLQDPGKPVSKISCPEAQEIKQIREAGATPRIFYSSGGGTRAQTAPGKVQGV